MFVEQQPAEAVAIAQLEFRVHLDGLERADLDANLAAHANRDVDIENLRVELRFADVIRLFVLALLDVNALWGTFLLANLARHTTHPGVRIMAVENEERKIARGFLGRQTFFRILDRRQPVCLDVTADKVPRRFRQPFNDAFTQHKSISSTFDVQCSMFDVSESTRNFMTERRTSNSNIDL